MSTWQVTLLFLAVVWLGLLLISLKKTIERIQFDLHDFFSTWKKTDPHYRRAVADLMVADIERIVELAKSGKSLVDVLIEMQKPIEKTPDKT